MNGSDARESSSLPGRAVGEFNALSLRDTNLPARAPRFSDCTLRDGEQQAGVSFSAEERIELATLIDGLGVYELELGTPAVSREDADSMERIAGLGLGSRLTALARAREDDIDQVADIGMHGVRLSLPISNRQRAAKIPLGDDEYLDLAIRSCAHAKERGLEVIFSPFDTTRAEPAFLARFLREITARQLVDRIRLVDTAGVAAPQTIAYLVTFMKQAGSDVAVEVHCHTDLGLATANTLAGVLAGAEYVSTTINGIGERSGNTATEEVAVALEVAYDYATGLELSRLGAVSSAVEEASRVRLQAHKPVVGAGSFAHETGPVVAGVLKDPSTAEPYAPEAVGQHRQIVLGKQSGLPALGFRLARLGIELDGGQSGEVLASVRAEASATGEGVDDARLRELAEAIAIRQKG